ncbi:MAG: tryptophan-rich sensory protein [Pseudomonadota bacterium]
MSISVVLLGLGGWLTYLGLGPWYDNLHLPPFQPPAWAFTPMWTLVLTLLAIATWLVARHGKRGCTGLALGLYGAQCVLNAGWSLLFFTMQRPEVALWELVALDLVLVLMIATYWPVSRLGGLLLVPYLVWLLLATAINVWIVNNNALTAGTEKMTAQQLDHEVYMQEAILVARENPKAPFGAVLVDRRLKKIVARGVNNSQANPTLHGEIAAINDYADRKGASWSDLSLYTTAEPCCMCQGAIVWAGIAEVVYGVSIGELQRLGWRQIDIPAAEVVARSWQKRPEIVAGVLADDCRKLFSQAAK